MLNLIYAALKKRLAEKVEPKLIDWFLGQYMEDDMEDGGALLWNTPTIFLEFLPVDWETRPGNLQTATLRLNAHLVNDTLYDNDQRILDATINHLGMESAVFVALMNWRCLLSYVPGFEALAGEPEDRVLIESMVRNTSEPDHAMRKQLVSVQGFSSRVFDYSATPQWQTVLATLQLDIQKVNVLP